MSNITLERVKKDYEESRRIRRPIEVVKYTDTMQEFIVGLTERDLARYLHFARTITDENQRRGLHPLEENPLFYSVLDAMHLVLRKKFQGYLQDKLEE